MTMKYLIDTVQSINRYLASHRSSKEPKRLLNMPEKSTSATRIPTLEITKILSNSTATKFKMSSLKKKMKSSHII